MTRKTNSNYVLRPQSVFDDFLFASVGEDDHGTDVSVLSALTRLDIDPWQRARELAQLPREASERALTAIIAKLNGIPAAETAPGSIAARLITLLPNAGAAGQAKIEAVVPSKTGKTVTSRVAITAVVAVALALAVQSIIAGAQQPASPQVSSSSVSAPAAVPHISAPATTQPQR